MKYWDKAWSLVDGCTPCSPGCEHCWSAVITRRFQMFWKHPLACDLVDGDGRFSGTIINYYSRLHIPLSRKKPTVWAVWNDLFHEDVPWTFQNEAYGTMLEPSHHTYLILTNRPQRMLDFVPGVTMEMPPNIYHGLTVCNQQEADEKIPIFLQVPGKKFLSLEPMLGPVDLREIPIRDNWKLDSLELPDGVCGDSKINAVILGGETGPGARPMHLDWVRKVRDDCQMAGVPFFFKSWGEWLQHNEAQNIFGDDDPRLSDSQRRRGGKSPMVSEGGHTFIRVGQKDADRLLDGREHNDLPWKTP